MTGTKDLAGEDEPISWRLSRLESAVGPAHGLRLVVADLHNHSLHSDGLGDPERAFAMMRSAGLDVAALTDHASIPRHEIRDLSLAHYPDDRALALGRLAPRSLDQHAWLRTAELADAHDDPGEFTALRGFEWTEPWLGHVNVWFSDSFIPVTTPGSLSGLFAFLADAEPQALFGYNHPGREPGALAHFERPPGALPERMVALEAFNRTDDFLFGGYADGRTSPLVACLDAGWRPALTGSSDEHGRSYGLAGKGRTGLWVREHSRDGVREALTARRAFATREAGLRLDATLGGARMGSALTGPAQSFTDVELELAVDLAGSAYAGAIVEMQLFTSGNSAAAPERTASSMWSLDRDERQVPVAARPRPAHPVAHGDGGEVALLHREPAVVGEVTRCSVRIPAGTRWVALRLADHRRGYGGPAPRRHACGTWAIAYASPWFLGSG